MGELHILSESSLGCIKAYVGEGMHPTRALPTDRPYFQRDALESIASFVQGLWLNKIKDRPLFGLVLAGG